MTAGVTNFPTSLDTTTNLPLAATLAAIELDGDGTDDQKHSNWAGAVGGAAVALETKIGTGASTPAANRVLASTGAGVSAWTESPVLPSPDINGGTIDGATVGAASASTGAFSTLSATGLITATGGQIAFPANQAASAGVNTLDDYEEGTFTPAIGDASLDGSGEGQTYSAQVGNYVKIGNRVFFTCRFTITDLGTLAAAHGANLVGLPFTSLTTANSESAIAVGYGASLALPTASESVTGFVAANATHIPLYNWDATAGPSVLTISELSAGATLMVSGQYGV